VKRFFLLFGILFGVAAIPGILLAQDKEPPSRDSAAKVRAQIAKFREKQKHGDLVVSLITPAGEVFEASGSQEAKGGHPAPTPDTPFELGSVTKVFTGILLSEAVQRGELRLDDPLDKILPDWKFPSVDSRRITPLDLTTHTSGLPPVPFEVATRALLPFLDPYATYSQENLKKDLKTIELKTPPGAKHAYSNLGVGLLGTVVTLKAGKTDFAGLTKERILDPWGMKSTVANQVKLPGRPKAYDDSHLPSIPWTFQALAGAGGLTSTTRDMDRFSKKWFDPGSSQPVLDRVRLPWREVPVVKTGDWETRAIGLGAFQARLKGTKETLYWHNGGTGGFSTFWGVMPEKKIAITIMASVSDRKVDKLAWDILAGELSRP